MEFWIVMLSLAAFCSQPCTFEVGDETAHRNSLMNGGTMMERTVIVTRGDKRAIITYLEGPGTRKGVRFRYE